MTESRTELSYVEALAVVGDVFAEVLGTAVDPDDNFFAFGGNSLRGALAVTKVGRRLQVALNLKDIFDHPTAIGLARAACDAPALESASPTTRADAASVPPPLSYMQRNRFLRVTRAQREGKTLFPAMVSFAVDFQGTTTDSRIVAALARVVEAHEALRTGFRVNSNTDEVHPYVIPAADVEKYLDHADHTGLPESEWHAAIEEHLADLSKDGFDYDDPPLMRARLCRFTETHAVLALVIEHQVFDGRSADILVSELASSLRDPHAPLPSPLQISQWIREQLQFLDSGEAKESMRYWRDSLSGTQPYPDLQLPGPTLPTDSRYAEFVDTLDTVQFAALRGNLGAETATPFLALLAAVAVAWRQLSGQDAVVHCPCENRQATGSDRVIGWLAHSLVLRQRTNGARTWREAVAAAREVAVSSYEHQAIPFPKVIQDLQPEMHGTATRQPRLYGAYDPLPAAPLSVPGGTVRQLHLPDPKTFADAGISFRATETTVGLSISTVFDPRQVSVEHANRLHQLLQGGMRQMCVDLDSAIEL